MAIIRIIKGEEKGRVINLPTTRPFSIGRDPESDLSLEGDEVSRHHAEIIAQEKVYFIKDLNSSNGTFINNKRITKEMLKDKNIIRIGQVELVFELSVAMSRPEIFETRLIPLDDDKGIRADLVEIKLSPDSQTPARHSVPTKGKEITSQPLTTAHQIARLIGSEKDIQPLLPEILKLLVGLTQANQGYILAWHKEQDIIMAQAMYPKEDPSLKISRTIVRRVIQYTRPLLTSDAMVDPRLPASQSAVLFNIKSVICVPLFSNPEGAGVIYLSSDKANWSFNTEHLELASTVGIQLGMVFSIKLPAELKWFFQSSYKSIR